MKTEVKHRVQVFATRAYWTWLFLFLLFGSLWAETYLLPLSECEFKGDEEEISLALETKLFVQQSGIFPFLRAEEEAYLIPANGDFTLQQGEYLLAVRMEEGKRMKGLVALRYSGEGSKDFSFEVEGKKELAVSEEKFQELRRSYYKSLAEQDDIVGGAWFRAQMRKGEEKELAAFTEMGGADWKRSSNLFSIFSGGLAVAENLALDRVIQVGEGEEEIWEKLADVEGVEVESVDWKVLLEKNEVPEKVSLDKTAELISEDQLAAFFPDLPTLLGSLNWLRAGVGELGGLRMRASVSQVLDFYEEQLGLQEFKKLAAGLPVKSVALTTSDAYLASGSEVALVFETEKPELVFQALSLAIRMSAKRAQASGADELASEGYPYLGYETTNRRFSSHLLQLEKGVILANSVNQIQSLLAVQTGEKQSLASLEEFRFFRHRYTLEEECDSFFFLSDATIRRWVNPKNRIGTARRMRAQALLVQLNAQLVAGGQNLDALAESLSEFMGELEVVEGSYHSSIYGSACFLTPISEMSFEEVTKAEADGYREWREGYERGWTVFDPIAFSFSINDETIECDLSVLPLTLGSGYQEVIEFMGKAVLSPEDCQLPAKALLQLAMAIDWQSEEVLQTMGLEEFAEELGITLKEFEWLGDNVSLTVYDDLIWDVVARSSFRDFDLIWSLPLGFRIDSQNREWLINFLQKLEVYVQREMEEEFVNWETKEEEGKAFVEIRMEEGLNSFYLSAASNGLLLAFRKDVLFRMLDEEAEEADEQESFVSQLGARMNLQGQAKRVHELERIFANVFFGRVNPEEWRILPLLNDLRKTLVREGHEEVEVFSMYERIYDRALQEGYRWNEESMTMESVEQGYPGSERSKEASVSPLNKWLLAYPKVQSSLSFEDEGLRVELSLSKGKEEVVEEKNFEILKEGGEVIGVAKGFLAFEPGTRWKVRSSYQRGEAGENDYHMGESEDTTVLVKCEKAGVELQMTYEVDSRSDEKESRSFVSHCVLDGNGNFCYKGDSGGDVGFVFEEPLVQLPGVIRKGMVFRVKEVAKIGVADERLAVVSDYEMTVVGREDVQVAAGRFPNCLYLEGRGMSASHEGVKPYEIYVWYAPGIGYVKFATLVGNFYKQDELLQYDLIGLD